MVHHIGKQRQLFVDSQLIWTTSAKRVLHEPRRAETVFTFDAPDGGDVSYPVLIYDAGQYKMYYIDWSIRDPRPLTVRVLLSSDGIHWERPELAKGGNVVFDPRDYGHPFDNFIPFIDTNPACPPARRYKAFSAGGWNTLRAFCSADGFDWKPMFNNEIIDMEGAFDSSNLAFYDSLRGEYRAYIRGFHDIPGDDREHNANLGIRDIRLSFSKDFEHWSRPQLIDFGNAPDIPLYVSVAQPYLYAPQYFFGFPVRYIERKSWEPAFDQLSNPEDRRFRMKQYEPRIGLAVTDCLFMSSRDGKTWDRSDEAFMRPGPVCEKSWVYGDCYLAVGMAPTKGERPGQPDEISMYIGENHFNGPQTLIRCTLRQDGFYSLHAGGCLTQTRTGTLLFEGGKLLLNAATAGLGSIRVGIFDAHDRPIEGFSVADCDDIFTDRVDYTVSWKGSSDVSSLAGKPIRLVFDMAEADLYSFRFAD